MAGSTVTMSVAHFAQQLKQKYTQYASVPDEKLVAVFLGKNPRYRGNYREGALVSVSFEPAAAAAAAAGGGTSSIQSQAVPTLAAPANPSAPAPVLNAGGAASPALQKTVVESVASLGVSAAATASQPAPVQIPPSSQASLRTTVVQETRNTVVEGRKQTVVEHTPAAAVLMVGRYQIVEELGRGGMGVVYKAFDPGIGRTVALKVMSEDLARDQTFRDRFLREARGAGILQHPNIVTVHELGEWENAPFIAMEFLQGRSLEVILTREMSTTTVAERLAMVEQVCRGLDYAHARGIVHRDIKPANVMVTTDGVAKVVDFGIARLADQKLTKTGHVLGTISYMSPEQLQGKPLDGRSDIFAVGVMLFEVLTSTLPFAAEDTGAAITNTLYRQPPGLANFLEHSPPELEAILNQCLAKNPAERFQAAGELADRLTQVWQQMQRAQAPTSMRAQPLPAAHSSLSAPGMPRPLTVSGEQIHQVAAKSAEYAQEWWKFASPRARRNVVTVACVAVLYPVAISVIAIPMAILAAMVLLAQAPFARKWWTSASLQARLAVGGLATALATFSFSRLAVGVTWYVTGVNLMGVPVGAVMATMVGANVGLAKDWWKLASAKARAVGALVSLFLMVISGVVVMNYISTPKSYFAKGGEFEQREKANQATLQAQRLAFESTPLQIWTDQSLATKLQFYRSHLMWTNKDNGAQLTWSAAQQYCGTLRLGSYADWRLPSLDELKSISEGKRGYDENIGIYHVKKGIFLSNPGIWANAEGTGFDFNNQLEGSGRALCVRPDHGN